MAGVDSRHQVWVSLQGGDEVARFDPKTETETETCQRRADAPNPSRGSEAGAAPAPNDAGEN